MKNCPRFAQTQQKGRKLLTFRHRGSLHRNSQAIVMQSTVNFFPSHCTFSVVFPFDDAMKARDLMELLPGQ